MENAMVLFTGGDLLGRNRTIEDYLLQPGSKIRQILEQFGNRYHVFDNKHTKDSSQVSQLVDKIDLLFGSQKLEREKAYSGEKRAKPDKGRNKEGLKDKVETVKMEKFSMQGEEPAKKKRTLSDFFSLKKGNQKRTGHAVSSTEQTDFVEKQKKPSKLQEEKDQKLEEKTKASGIKHDENMIKQNEGWKDQPSKRRTHNTEAETTRVQKEDIRMENKRDVSGKGQNYTITHERMKDQPTTELTQAKQQKQNSEAETTEVQKEDNRMKKERDVSRKGQKYTITHEGMKDQPITELTQTKQQKQNNEADTTEVQKEENRMENKRDVSMMRQKYNKSYEAMKDLPTTELTQAKQQKQNTEAETTEVQKEDNRMEKERDVSKKGQKYTITHEGMKDQPTTELTQAKQQKQNSEAETTEVQKEDNRMENKRDVSRNGQKYTKANEGMKDQPKTKLTQTLQEETLNKNDNKQENLKEKLNGRTKDMMLTTAHHPDKPSSTQRDGSTKTEDPISEKTEHITGFFKRLNLRNRRQDKLKMTDILHISKLSLQCQEPLDEGELINCFLQKLIKINYTARNLYILNVPTDSMGQKEKGDEVNATNYKNKDHPEADFNIHPMDVQMAVFHSADGLLKQFLVTKLSECQYALPLLVPNPFTQQIEFPLWTFRQITKSWKIKNTNKETVSTTQPVYRAETPMVAFFRFGSMSSSKSQLINSLINERHDTFFHRNCPGSSRTRVLMDGVVEIAWYCPSGKDRDKFTDCVAFCNLHGDAGDHERQLNILTEMASVNVVLLPQLDRTDINATKIQKIYKNSTTVICLLSESNSAFTVMRKGKYKIGLKNRNQSAVIDELCGVINDVLSNKSSGSHSVFRLDEMVGRSNIRVDEDDDDCKRGKEKAQQMVSLLEKKDLTEIKNDFLPCQGKLWHQWCQKNKELHQPRGDKTETDISTKQSHLEEIRKQQHESNISQFMKLFLEQMNSENKDEKIYFLKWLDILLDECTSENRSALHLKYQKQCSKILKLRECHDKYEEMSAEHQELQEISVNLQAAAFGLEHILREIGQIYESCSSVNKNKKDLPVHFSSLPSVAAEMMISGFPLELMDGDAAHVPLIWVTAVLDALINKLGDVSVFVLTVLGIQSSGKSTLLNTMFGLQFAVSAGRCTRGAFMQLVRLSEDMKAQLMCDYILVVDTEGLCSPELSGRETRHHDNELATFVAGLGNLTLINIFGESAADIHNILQIVVQAFLRMKLVKLNPSCMFVHQNISDVTAEDKNIEGKRTLQEELDKMTKLAAEEEVCEVRGFKDVIKFSVQNDVKYFAQLWEGTPPMAPPCPDYSDSVQDLKRTILSRVSKSDGITLTRLKQHIQDLWKALLHERFVFSFKNSLEVANYRKLETEYSKWSWSLQSFMLEIESKLLNKIENGAIHDITDKDFTDKLQEKSEEINKDMVEFLKKNKNASLLSQWKAFEIKLKEFQESIVRESKRKLKEVLQQQHMKDKINAQRKHDENVLFEKSKKLKDKVKGGKNLQETFDQHWKQWLDDIKKDAPALQNIDISSDISQIITTMNEGDSGDYLDKKNESSDITSASNYSDYVRFIEKSGRENKIYLSQENQLQIYALVQDIVEETREMMESFKIAQFGYNIIYMHQLRDYIKRKVKKHEEQVAYVFKKKFTLDLTLHICKKAEKIFTDQHSIYWEASDPAFYFGRKREEYYNIFKKYCHGATESAIFGEFICNKLKEPIQESAYKKTAKELADEMKTNCEPFNGNRSKLEKHILEMLAEKENFSTYMQYIHNPIEHFKSFIRDEVSKYISENFRVSILPRINKHIELQQQKIIEAAHEASQKKSGDVESWLKTFTHKLSDVLIFPEKTFTGVSRDDVDVNLLEDAIRIGLAPAMLSINNEFNQGCFPGKLSEKDRPDEILIKHFCRCCWVQCPFCKAICTNTIENHIGDHSVPFHRNVGLNGWHYTGTPYLNVNICTSEVATDHSFYPNGSAGKAFPWRQYRRAGPAYADWSITPDLSELPYWKWFVQRFGKDLEHYYKKTLLESTIPKKWKEFTKQKAIKSLNEYYG